MCDESNKNKQDVCLDFGGANCTYIETNDDHLDEEEDINAWFAKNGISEDDAVDWAKKT